MRLSRLKDSIDTLIRDWGPNHEVLVYNNLRSSFEEPEIVGISEFDPDKDSSNDFLVLHSKDTDIESIIGEDDDGLS